jgi:hypothetical protein
VSWDKTGRYYHRCRRVSGRVVSEYVGSGEAAAAAARADAEDRARRREAAAALQEERDWLESLDADLTALCAWADLVARAALVAAGYHQHKGQWRKRRAPDKPNA